jgi:hypothetical protein
MAVNDGAADKITDGKRDQHRGDQTSPSAHPAPKIRKQIATSQHLETHKHAPDKEGVRIDQE